MISRDLNKRIVKALWTDGRTRPRRVARTHLKVDVDDMSIVLKLMTTMTMMIHFVVKDGLNVMRVLCFEDKQSINSYFYWEV